MEPQAADLGDYTSLLAMVRRYFDVVYSDLLMSPYSIYLHVPFCQHRCSYCDFNTYSELEYLIPAYVDALCMEIAFTAQASETRLPVYTIYFGGGTPSLLPASSFEQIFKSIDDHFDLQPDTEISLEANPGTLSLEYLADLRSIGFNRISLGVQSANPQELAILERQHDFPAVIQSCSWARLAGFLNINLDLIFGLPYQSLASWQQSLNLVLGLDPDHLSLYDLTLEHGTPLGHWAGRGLISVPDPDLAAEMYEWTLDRLDQENFEHYEISNWGKKRGSSSFACRHNLQYWRNLPYLGFGAGAHGYAAGYRAANVLAPAAYIRRFDTSTDNLSFPRTPATQTFNKVSLEDEIGETMMMGLRLVQEGISDRKFQDRFGGALNQRFGRQIDRLVDLGLLERAGPDGDILRLTRRGYLLGNQVFVEFI